MQTARKCPGDQIASVIPGWYDPRSVSGVVEEPGPSVDYKTTLNLPRTEFPMRGNLPKREPETIRRWTDERLYERMLEHRAGSPTFVLHDGPPYANGNIHIGHTLNKVLKDIIVRFRSMAGWRSPYVPGWDCHGLPIELQVERKLGRKRDTAKTEFRRHCREYAERYVNVQREEFRRLGVLGDWERPYLTMAPAYEAAEVRALGKFFESGAVYRGRKPVLWCPSCATALAEAEVEYEDVGSPSIYVTFPLLAPFPEPLQKHSGSEIAIAIWTTTPWTLPANLAIAVHPDFEYVLAAFDGQLLIVAKELVGALATAGAAKHVHVLESFRGRALERAQARHPWLDQTSLVVLGDHVTLDTGTGCVHTAPGHGQEDYEVGLRYGLPVYAPVDARGRFTNEVRDFAGEFVFDADEKIIARLREVGRLLKGETQSHSYPHCWRCKNPVIFRATYQWFVSMETSDLRAKALSEIDRVRWIPSWGRDRIRGMMEFRPDWCISRQRSWGVPIVAFFCSRCDEVMANRAVADHVANLFEREGSDLWFAAPASELVPPDARCSRCGGADFRKEEDILDVWFDSGLSHEAVLEVREDLRWPADLYLEGSDQHRGWFHTSLLSAIVTRGRAPYDAVLTHGFTVDASGRKMSKSLGNVVTPQEIFEKNGAEILRLWVAAEDYRDDVRISAEILGRLIEAFRRIRNTARFLIANLFDFDLAKDSVNADEFPELDRWILDRTDRLVARCHQAYLDYEFHVVVHALNNFCSVDLSSLYLDVAKDRLYCSAPNDRGRRAAQTATALVLDRLTKIMAPILAFTADEIWGYMPGAGKREASVFLSDFPSPNAADDELAATWEKLLEVRAVVTKALEEWRKQGLIGQSLEARVTLHVADRELAELLTSRLGDLPALFIVSQVEVAPGDGGATNGVGVTVAHALGRKCARCWNYRTPSTERPDVCDRCSSVVTALST